MEKFKKIGKALLFPHVALVIMLSIASIAALAIAFLVLPDNAVVNYASYVLSAYTLTVVCFRIPAIIKWVKRFTETNKLASSLKHDAHLRIKVSLLGSMVFNAFYALFQLGLGIYNHSVWFYALAGYYFLLAFLRVFMLNHTLKFKPGEKEFRELLIYRMCGIGLVIMNLALVIIIAYVTAFSKATVHHMIITIALAAFSFTAITVAIVNIVKYRKYNSPVWSASKALSFVAALVSMLTLEDAMLATFGQAEGEGFRQLMGGLTGAGVTAIVLAIAIYMIIGSTKKIKAFENKNPLQ
ncbi:MAG: hypothetical protein E7611_07205 [Ruminococcaceae bacterium]|nr:hypothetical protein [Oscillospiraceae bacterium]